MNDFLPDTSKRKLASMHKRESDPRIKIRLAACIAYKDGKSTSEIAAELDVKKITVASWIRRANAFGVEGMYRNRGTISKLDDDQIKKLVMDVSAGPRACGFNVNGWTLKMIRQHVKKKYGMPYTRAGIHVILEREGVEWKSLPGCNFLPDVDRKKLASMHKTERDPKIKKRLTVCIARKDGKTMAEISEDLGIPMVTVHQWLKRIGDLGVKGLYDKNKGRTTRLNNEQIMCIKHDLAAGPRSFGYNSNQWTLKMIVQHVDKKYGMKYTDTGIRQLLYRKGISYNLSR